jgi:predicted RNA binding protein YcfA (HicA-like mRNA interferase family)
MNPRAPRVTARDIVRVLERRGFVLARSSGSHRIFKDANGRRVTVPVHAGKVLHPKVLNSILYDADLTVDGLISELEK